MSAYASICNTKINTFLIIFNINLSKQYETNCIFQNTKDIQLKKMTDPVQQLQEFISKVNWKKTDQEIFKNTILFKKGYRFKDGIKFYIHVFVFITVFILGILALVNRHGFFTFFILLPLVIVGSSCNGYLIYLTYVDIVETYKERSVLHMNNIELP